MVSEAQLITVTMSRKLWDELLMWHASGVGDRAVGSAEIREAALCVAPIQIAMQAAETPQ